MNYEISSLWNEKIASNLCSVCRSCKQDCTPNIIYKKECKKTRTIHKVYRVSLDFGEIYCCSGDKAEINSNRIFKARIEILKDILLSLHDVNEKIKESVNQNTKRLLHNVTTLNAHNIQELYALVPQETLTQNLNTQLSIIEQEIYNDPSEAAKTFLRIAKNNAALKTEFSVFKKLFEIEPNLQIKKHLIHKVLFNLLHIFFQDFTDLGVRIKIADTQAQVSVDYESIQVALYHFFDNAVKYCAPRENIIITFESSDYSFFVKVDMISLEIEPDEVNLIFEEGYCGKNAKILKKNGNGIGLNFVNRILKLNNAELKLKANINPRRNKYFQGLRYTNNVFELHFNY